MDINHYLYCINNKTNIMNKFIEILWKGINGKFGDKVLLPKYRLIWMIITYSIIIVLAFYILYDISEWWNKIVIRANHAIYVSR